ncbi:MAG TPA: hypothetical protein DCS93_16925 [Microscillaceae bacterium]|nr:hypothetical protein [Microscillaceae bacterium]
MKQMNHKLTIECPQHQVADYLENAIPSFGEALRYWDIYVPEVFDQKRECRPYKFAMTTDHLYPEQIVGVLMNMTGIYYAKEMIAIERELGIWVIRTYQLPEDAQRSINMIYPIKKQS